MKREAFIANISSEQEPLRRFLLALCEGDRMEAEDIAQEAMIKAYLSSDRFVERCKFSTWLFKIAYNTFLDHKRSVRNHETDLEAAGFMAATQSADDAFIYQELYEAIGTLPLKEKSAILLFYVSGYTVKEISKITSCSQLAVKQQLSRGRDKLRQLLKQ
ncbi:MAG: RNA polymerase sigma factor [Bacteroidales bacterium]|nr:RNA polymerase sigma factor [Bacteroidales bacterium]